MQLTDAIKAEIEFFINAMENERMDTKAIGVKNADKQQCLSLLKKCYGILCGYGQITAAGSNKLKK